MVWWKRASTEGPSCTAGVVLIAGGRRTGTTLVNAILCSEPDANRLGQEAQILTRLVEAYRFGADNFENFGQSYFENSEGHHSLYLSAVENFVESARHMGGGKEFLVLKNPEFSLVLPELQRLLPGGRTIVVVRDPRDQVCSELEVGRRQIEAGHDVPVMVERDVARLADNFLHYYLRIPRPSDMGSRPVHTVRYEDLVLEPDQTLRDLGDFLGRRLSFDPRSSWERVSERADLHQGPSQSPLYGLPIEASSVGRYRTELNEKERHTVEERCCAFMETHGYSVS